MSREDVIFGSNVGNTTNPQFLEVDNWVKYWFLHFIIPMDFRDDNEHSSS